MEDTKSPRTPLICLRACDQHELEKLPHSTMFCTTDYSSAQPVRTLSVAIAVLAYDINTQNTQYSVSHSTLLTHTKSALIL
jgi:hypothetical protein